MIFIITYVLCRKIFLSAVLMKFENICRRVLLNIRRLYVELVTVSTGY